MFWLCSGGGDEPMSTQKVAQEFSTALKSGDYVKAESFWADDVLSVEAREGDGKEARGREAVHAKGEWWMANHEVHNFNTTGPFINGDQFALLFAIDVTQKASGERIKMDEVALYTVRDGKISEERFFY
jgi:ketosteroid isomerase-like protein